MLLNAKKAEQLLMEEAAAVAEFDATWFAQNPLRTIFLRVPSEGERRLSEVEGFCLVVQIMPGVRIRIQIYPGDLVSLGATPPADENTCLALFELAARSIDKTPGLNDMLNLYKVYNPAPGLLN